MRTIVDLPADSIRQLAEVCQREGISRAEAVRRAVALYLREQGTGDRDEAFGLWVGRGPDALEYEDQIREEWSGAKR